MLTRKMLTAMEIPSDKIDEIINSHAESVNALKEQIDALKSVNSELETKAKELPTVTKERDEALEKLKAVSDDGLADKYDALKKEYDDYKTDVENQKVREQKIALFKDVLADVGITDEKSVAKVVKYSDIDEMEISDGKLVDSSEIAKTVKEEWAELVTTTEKTGIKTPKPPASNGGSGMTKEDILAIKDTAERQKAMAENHELFGI